MASTSASATQSASDTVFRTLQEANEPKAQVELEVLTGLSGTALSEAINDLLQRSKINVMSTSAGVIAFQISAETQVAKQQKLKGLMKDELLIYQIIEQSADKGIWTKDMKVRSNVPATRLPKILKTLEGRNLIKAVKGVSGGSRKIYMLFELQPSEELTGGTWFSDNHLDEDFVESMRNICRVYIERQGTATLAQIGAFIEERGFAEVALPEREIKKIVTTLVYDGEIDEVTGEDEVSHYVLQPLPPPASTALSSMPCGQCPVMHECKEGSDISPSTCIYMETWLDF